MVTNLRQLVLLGVVAGALACSKKTPEPTVKAATTPPPAPTAPAPSATDTSTTVTGEGKLDPNDPKHGTRKLVGLDAPVYVDGVQVAILRHGEMPPIPVTKLEG